MQNGKRLDLSFSATQTKASAKIAQISQDLAAQGLPAHKAGDVKIALAEAINNVVEHAYADVDRAEVKVQCWMCRNCLKILISDSGNPLPGLRVPDSVPAPLGSAIEELPEGGFGWFLIKEVTSDIRYERSGGRNQLSLRFDFVDAV